MNGYLSSLPRAVTNPTPRDVVEYERASPVQAGTTRTSGGTSRTFSASLVGLNNCRGRDPSRIGRKLYAERDRFGKWQHLLGPENVLVSWTVDSPSHGVIRRLEVQAHLGDSGEDDLCAPSLFEQRWEKLQLFMGMVGVLPPEDPVCVRVDAAVDVRVSGIHVRGSGCSKRSGSPAGLVSGTRNGKVLRPTPLSRSRRGTEHDWACVLPEHEA